MLITANSARGYECLINANTGTPSVQIMRWNGGVGDFTNITVADNAPSVVADGDVLKARYSGNTITFFQNGVQIAHATDSTWTTGFPGIGFDKPLAADPNLFGFSSMSVVPI